MFWKNKPTGNQPPNKVANSLAKAIIMCQIAFANFLNRRTGNWTVRTQKLFLAGFFAVTTTVIILQLAMQKSAQLLSPPTIHKAPALIIPLSPDQNPKQFSLQDSLALERFRHRLRQLQATPEGRDSLRGFEQQRPGFIDSVLNMEKMLRQSN